MFSYHAELVVPFIVKTPFIQLHVRPDSVFDWTSACSEISCTALNLFMSAFTVSISLESTQNKVIKLYIIYFKKK